MDRRHGESYGREMQYPTAASMLHPLSGWGEGMIGERDWIAAVIGYNVDLATSPLPEIP